MKILGVVSAVLLAGGCVQEPEELGETAQAGGPRFPPFASMFTNKQFAGWDLCYSGEICRLGDVDGDGDEDLIQFTNTSQLPAVRVALFDRDYGVFVDQGVWLWGFCPRGNQCVVGDLDADGRADIVSIPTNGQQVTAALSTSGGFDWPRAYGYACYAGQECMLANVDNTPGDDMVGFDRATRKAWVYPNDGTEFWTQTVWSNYFCGPNERCTVGDVTGDGRADVISFVNGQAWVGVTAGTYFGDIYIGWFEQAALWSSYFCPNTAEDCHVADVTGDGRADLVSFVHQTADSSIWVARAKSTFGGGFEAPVQWSAGPICGPTETCLLGQLDDYIADDIVTLTRDPTNYGYISFGL